MKYDKIQRNPSQLASLTEFEAFVSAFEYHLNTHYSCFTFKTNGKSLIIAKPVSCL